MDFVTSIRCLPTPPRCEKQPSLVGRPTGTTGPERSGAERVYCSVSGLSASAVFTMVNAYPAPAIATCGPCEWLLPSGRVVMPVTPFQNASFVYTLGCTPSLVGVQFQTQWTTYDPGPVPCPVCFEFVLSDRLLQVIGQ